MLAASRRRTAYSLNLKSVLVTGTFYPGYAGAEPLTNSVSYTPGESLSNVTIPFSNVPTGNNEWATFDFVGVAPDGTEISIGELAGLFNVGGSTATGTLSAQTTLRFQLAMFLLNLGSLSLDDLQEQTTLDSDLSDYTSPLTPDANTGLLSNGQLTQLASKLQPIYNRTLVITSSTTTDSTMTIAPDYSQPAVRDVAANFYSTDQLFAPGVFPMDPGVQNVYGSPTGLFQQSSVPSRTPYNPTISAASDEVDAQPFPAPNGTLTLSGVYGGPILVGTYPNDGTFRSDAIGVGNRAPGSSTNIGLTLSTTSATFTIADPQTATFAQSYPSAVANAELYFQATAAYNDLQVPLLYIYNTNITSLDDNLSGTGAGTLGYNYVAGSANGSTYQITMNTFSPFGIQLSQQQICGGTTCIPANSSGNFNLPALFFDPGTNLAFYNYAVGGAVTSISADTSDIGNCAGNAGTCGYLLNVSGTQGDIVTTRTAYFSNGQKVVVKSTSGTSKGSGAVQLPAGTDVRVQVTCNGQTYFNDGLVGDPTISAISGEAIVYMNSLPTIETCQSTAIGITLPSAVTGALYRLVEL